MERVWKDHILEKLGSRRNQNLENNVTPDQNSNTIKVTNIANAISTRITLSTTTTTTTTNTITTTTNTNTTTTTKTTTTTTTTNSRI